MNIPLIVRFIIISLLLPLVCYSQNDSTRQTTGPASGHLVIVGGGGQIRPILERFVELAGGPEARIVVIPTAGGSDSYGDNAAGAGILRDIGARSVTMLHSNDRSIADSDSFVAPLKRATGVWFGGGRQWRLVDAYKDPKTEALLWQVLERNGVIGGSSAGATIQGSYLARGDTKTNQIMMGDHEQGFGFIKNITIDQHTLARNRHFDMFDILKNRPELLGLSVDENTAVIVSVTHLKSWAKVMYLFMTARSGRAKAGI